MHDPIISTRSKILIDMTDLEKYKVEVLEEQSDEYGGAHKYAAFACRGFVDGKTEYSNGYEVISFVKKTEEGVAEGLTNEQLLAIMIDRTKKLNNRFPSREGALAITKMEEALMWTERRVQNRINRGVMGELKK